MATATSALRFDLFARDQTGPGIRSAEGNFNKLSGVGKKLGGAFAAVGVGAAVGLGALGKASFDAASDLQQSMGAVDAVFGKSADEVKAWADTSAQKLGLASSEYGNLASLLGSQLTNMGRSQSEAAKQSDNLIGLGADLAATFGGSVADAVGAVSSVLKGETDPIERYGVSIKASDISARLAAKGLDKLEGSAKKQATATAALELITEQTTKAQGAFGRESDTAAGQQARLSANIKNLKADLGSALLPVMTKTFGFLNAQAIPALKSFFTNVKSGGGAFARFRAGLAAIGAYIQGTVLPLLQRFGQWFTTVGWPAVQRFAAVFWEKLQPALKSIGTAIQTQLVPALQNAIVKFKEAWPTIQRVLTILGQIAGFILSRVVPVLIQFYSKYLANMIKVFANVFSVVWRIIGVLVNLGAAIGRAGAAFGSFVGKVAGAIGRAWSAVKTGVGNIVSTVAAFPGKAIKALGDLSRDLWQMGIDFLAGFIGGIVEKAKELPGIIKDKVVGAVKSAITLGGLLGSPSRLMMKYGRWFTEGFAIGLKDKTKDVMANVESLMDKLKEKVSEVRSFAEAIRDAFRSSGDVTGIDTMIPGLAGGDDTEGGFGALLAGLQKKAAAAQEFAKGLTKLRKMGLNETSLTQLREAGPESGLKATQQLLTGGKGGIGQVNALAQSISAAGAGLATREAKAKYGFGPEGPGMARIKGQDLKLTINGSGDDLTKAIVKALRQHVRKGGGSAQVVLGSG